MKLLNFLFLLLNTTKVRIQNQAHCAKSDGGILQYPAFFQGQNMTSTPTLRQSIKADAIKLQKQDQSLLKLSILRQKLRIKREFMKVSKDGYAKCI